MAVKINSNNYLFSPSNATNSVVYENRKLNETTVMK